MGPFGFTEYLAAAHRQNLLHEARRAAQAAEATARTSDIRSAALLHVADLLLYAGRRLRARAIHRRLARSSHAALCAAGVHQCHPHHHTHLHDDALPRRILWLDG